MRSSTVTKLGACLSLALASPACGKSDHDGDAGSAPRDAAADASAGPPADAFSFFVASYAAMERLSGSSAGFGGDLRYGERDGLAGADKICTEIAEGSMPGSGKKRWRAFLSVTRGPDGQPVHAIDRVGEGPWYDRLGRLLAKTRADLLHERPLGADALIVNDLPNEDGVPNLAPDGEQVDNHDILTGTNDEGQLYDEDWSSTCHDWTSAVGSDGRPRVGHSWPRSAVAPMGGGPMFSGDGPPPGAMGMPGPPPGDGGQSGSFMRGDGDGGFVFGPGPMMRPPGDGGFVTMGMMGGPGGGSSGENWMSALDEAGCAPGVNLIENGPPNPDDPTVGSGGGYGGIYCFALAP